MVPVLNGTYTFGRKINSKTHAIGRQISVRVRFPQLTMPRPDANTNVPVVWLLPRHRASCTFCQIIDQAHLDAAEFLSNADLLSRLHHRHHLALQQKLQPRLIRVATPTHCFRTSLGYSSVGRQCSALRCLKRAVFPRKTLPTTIYC